MKEKVFIFGAGTIGESLISTIQVKYDIVEFIDNDEKRWGNSVGEYLVFPPEKISDVPYNYIIIGTPVPNAIIRQLSEMGVSRDKILDDFVVIPVKSRIIFLEKLAELFKQNNVEGSVAEGGVFQGEFSREINRIFPQSPLYLFDTFSGFDERDILVEQKNEYSKFGKGHFNITSVDLVLNNLLYPDKCIIRQGYFPETTIGINDHFCFVNLDFDLYKPILAGLEFFYPRMVSGGIILVHDYFNSGYKGVKEAIADFAKKQPNLNLFPIGDGISIGICC
jgi:hypothetical protein